MQPNEMKPAADAITKVDSRLNDQTPFAWIILGSGLGGLADAIESPVSIPYESIPGLVKATAGGHAGRLILGEFAGRYVAAMAGRFHRYEGWSVQQLTAPVRLAAEIGCERLIVSNAAGGLSPKFRVGDLMLIEDHVNWIGDLPIESTSTAPKASYRFGSEAPFYDRSMMEAAQSTAMASGFSLAKGTYLATLGPTYETRAEYRMMRKLGADAVGMSTVPEALMGRRLGMRVMAISMISNVADPDRPVVADHSEVVAAGKEASGRMETVVRGILS
ncbi:MAG: purine-nucleoside phosphorylase [Planctomycetota bacterium]